MTRAALAVLVIAVGCGAHDAGRPTAARPASSAPWPAPIREEVLTTRDAGEPAAGTGVPSEPTSSLASPTVPPVRVHLGLTIHDPPRVRSDSALGLIASDVEGTLQVNGQRTWVGPPVPMHVPAGLEALELFQLHAGPSGHFALYRDMFAAGGLPGCAAHSMFDNCTYRGRFYRLDGSLAVDIDFNAHMPRRDHLRIGDLLLDGETLFYSQACQTYAKDANGECSHVVALDLSTSPPTERWRSRALVSNAPIRALGDYLVTGYGFTAEPDYLAVLDKRTGAVVLQVGLPTAPEGIAILGDVVEVHVYGRLDPLRFSASGFAATPNDSVSTLTARPRLLRLRNRK